MSQANDRNCFFYLLVKAHLKVTAKKLMLKMQLHGVTMVMKHLKYLGLVKVRPMYFVSILYNRLNTLFSDPNNTNVLQNTFHNFNAYRFL